MIVLDTDVVSEPMRANADRAVQAWLDLQVAETLYLTATRVSELPVGVEILPAGKRKEGLASALDELWRCCSERASCRSTAPPQSPMPPLSAAHERAAGPSRWRMGRSPPSPGSMGLPLPHGTRPPSSVPACLSSTPGRAVALERPRETSSYVDSSISS